MRRGPGIASMTLMLVIVLAGGALAYGAMHDGSKPHSFGSADDRAAARRNLILLAAPGLAVDRTFTACGNTADACFTSTGSITETLASLGSAVSAAGGRLDTKCGPFAEDPNDVTGYTCAVEGRLHGAWISVLVGDGWLLPTHPGQPMAKSAALIHIESKAADQPPAVTASLPALPPDVRLFVPSTWANPTDACTSLVPVLVSPTPIASGSGAAPAADAPPPDCPAHTASVQVATSASIIEAAKELAQVALEAGFRVDGLPCAKDSRQSSCHFVAERRGSSSGVLLHEHLETMLEALSNGQVGGTLTLTDLT